VVLDLVAEAYGRLGISPVRDAFATPANQRFAAYWTREDDAFAEPWDYATAGSLWANPLPAAWRSVGECGPGGQPHAGQPEWTGPQYPWWTSLCALCRNRWCLP